MHVIDLNLEEALNTMGYDDRGDSVTIRGPLLYACHAMVSRFVELRPSLAAAAVIDHIAHAARRAAPTHAHTRTH